MKEITDEMIAKACEEVDQAIIEQLEKDMEGKPPHEFSPEFERKMAELIGGMKNDRA